MKEKRIPMRRCVGCMQSKPKRELIRIAAGENGARPDPTGKANGRGVYLCRDRECFLKAKKRKSVGRGLGVELTAGQMELLLGELEEVFGIEH
ncbi:MAG: YlxR family protein [Clostridiales Family XIII bacterium]|jgi:predicted RNA-binding protein YlxR (DUF448 family)|nr:YlxR family protein [Clostridiales Family XIII bacterium]